MDNYLSFEQLFIFVTIVLLSGLITLLFLKNFDVIKHYYRHQCDSDDPDDPDDPDDSDDPDESNKPKNLVKLVYKIDGVIECEITSGTIINNSTVIINYKKHD